MKKAITICLTLLYLASFSGIVLGSDRDIHSSADVVAIKKNGTAHSEEAEPHPMLQFCKLIEIHKVVSVSGAAKKLRAAVVTLPSTNYLTFLNTFNFQPALSEVSSALSAKLFLSNCVLLI